MVDLLAQAGITEQRVIASRQRGTNEFRVEFWEPEEGAGLRPIHHYRNSIKQRVDGVTILWSDDIRSWHDGRTTSVMMRLGVVGQVSIHSPPANVGPQETATEFGDKARPPVGKALETKGSCALGFPVCMSIVPYTGK